MEAVLAEAEAEAATPELVAREVRGAARVGQARRQELQGAEEVTGGGTCEA